MECVILDARSVVTGDAWISHKPVTDEVEYVISKQRERL